jgi:hypothetical protein
MYHQASILKMLDSNKRMPRACLKAGGLLQNIISAKLDEKNATPALNESGALQYPLCGVYLTRRAKLASFPNFLGVDDTIPPLNVSLESPTFVLISPPSVSARDLMPYYL